MKICLQINCHCTAPQPDTQLIMQGGRGKIMGTPIFSQKMHFLINVSMYRNMMLKLKCRFCHSYWVVKLNGLPTKSIEINSMLTVTLTNEEIPLIVVSIGHQRLLSQYETRDYCLNRTLEIIVLIGHQRLLSQQDTRDYCLDMTLWIIVSIGPLCTIET